MSEYCSECGQPMNGDMDNLAERIEALEAFNREWKVPCTPSFLTKMRQELEETIRRLAALERQVQDLIDPLRRDQ